MRKKLLSMILSVSMMLAMAPMSVMAEDVIDTEEELVAALEAGGEVTLGGDIEICHYVYVNEDVVLDLNGYTITTTEYYDEDEDYYYRGSIVFGDEASCDVVIKDSKGGGGILDDGYADGAVYVDDGICTIESGEFYCVDIIGGQLILDGGKIEYVTAGGYSSTPYVEASDEVEIEHWDIGIATFNFDPTDYLYTGYGVNDNEDGTYTTKYVVVEETGETYTLYFYNWIDEYDCYYFGDDDMKTENMVVEISYVKGNADDDVVVPMTMLDEDGKYWSAQIDVAYKNALIQFASEELGYSTYLLATPDKDGAMYSRENDWTIYGMDEDIDEIGDELGEYSEATVTADDKDELEAILAEANLKLAEDEYLSEAQKEALNTIKANAQALLAVINNAGNVSGGNGGQTGSGDTGDSTNMMLWIALMAVGVSLLVGAKKYRRSEG